MSAAASVVASGKLLVFLRASETKNREVHELAVILSVVWFTFWVLHHSNRGFSGCHCVV